MRKHLSGILMIVLGFALCMPAKAQNQIIVGPGTGNIGYSPSKGLIIGVVLGVVAAVAVATVVVVHESSKKRTITGCVNPAQNEITVINEKDKQVYILSGDTAGVKPGERMSFQGKKIKPNASNPLGWEVTRIQTDYGACHP
ncbi:MAG TPA: hypothetical protein VNV41_04955 [Candidatus Acidoferrales bacterium]|jgi:MFS superfamily sulfate permease-like transporter|nr:hypothetical protein [Candidatus Acidoferrales bacterium]